MLSTDSSILPFAPPLRSRRQEELLDALEELALGEGFGRLTVGDLAARLKCSRSTLYAIAPSKEELFLAVEERFLHRVLTRAVECCEEGEDPPTRLVGFISGALEALGSVGASYLAEIQTYAPARRLLDDFRRASLERLRVLIEEGVEAGAFVPVNTRLAAELLDAAANRIQDPRVLAETGLTAGEALADIVRVVINGLLAPPQ